jgi:hypothetical protein
MDGVAMQGIKKLFILAAMLLCVHAQGQITEGGIAIDAGKISSGNSSTAALGISGVFTGATDVVFSFATISVFLDTDVGGTLSMQFSTDGTNWDRAKLITVPAAGGEKPHTLTVISKYWNHGARPHALRES